MEIDIQEKNIGIANVDRSLQAFTLFLRLPVQKTPRSRRLIVKLYTLFKTQDFENHTLFSVGTFPYRPNKGAPPGFLWQGVDLQTRLFAVPVWFVRKSAQS